MATREIKLTGSELMLVWNVVRTAPAMNPQSTLEDRERRRSLYYFLKREMDAHNGERLDAEYTLRLSNTRRRILTDMLDTPPATRPWPAEQRFEVVEPILEKLGYWTVPEFDLDEDDDEEDEG